MSFFSDSRYTARRKFFALAGQVYIRRPDGELLCYVRQTLFKLKEEITVFADENRTEPLLEIRARQIIDFAAAYDVSDAISGQKLGMLKRRGFASLLRDEWLVMDSEDRPVARLREASRWGALASRLLSLIPQRYILETTDGKTVALVRQRFAFFVHEFDIDFPPAETDAIDRKLAIASLILLLLIEGRQG